MTLYDLILLWGVVLAQTAIGYVVIELTGFVKRRAHRAKDLPAKELKLAAEALEGSLNNY